VILRDLLCACGLLSRSAPSALPGDPGPRSAQRVKARAGTLSRAAGLDSRVRRSPLRTDRVGFCRFLCVRLQFWLQDCSSPASESVLPHAHSVPTCFSVKDSAARCSPPHRKVATVSRFGLHHRFMHKVLGFLLERIFLFFHCGLLR
jgi:hypothetical protein